ncbi:MAG TPA: hypothetical protein VK138_03030 [Acidiferrobacterales bacterium]|nr:hypothetical protein [Acidiferrobacterales bacterium]
MLPDLHQESLEFFNTKILTMSGKLDLLLRNAHWDVTGAPEADRPDHPVYEHKIKVSTNNCEETITISLEAYIGRMWDWRVEELFLNAMKKLKDCETKGGRG